MATISTYTKDGKKSGTMTVPKSLTDSKPNRPFLHQVVVGLLANRRRPTAHTKDRGEVSGGGKKPWRQKGTGRARAGSTRSPLWRGGGVTFGPRSNRNYSHRIPLTSRKLAFRQVLGAKIRDGSLLIIAALELAKPKTKLLEDRLQKLPLKEGKILLIVEEMTPEVQRAGRNLPYLTLRTTATVNVLDLLVADSIITTKKAFEIMEKRYADS